MTLRPIGDMLINPEHAPWVEDALSSLASETAKAQIESALEAFAASDGFWSVPTRLRPYVVTDGVLTVPVHGMLLNDFPFSFAGMATGYEYITAAVQRGAADPAVRSIVLDVDSPGGVVSGCFDCADVLHGLRGAKPMTAAVNDHAYSAAYAIASSAHKIVMARTGGVGSIGVIARHVDQSERLNAAGLKVTFVYAGKHKTDGRPELPLSDSARAEWQERIDASYEIFVALVARNRGISESAVRATEAATYIPKAAIERGLADKVGTFGEIVSASADPIIFDEDDEMSNNDTSAAVQAANETALAQARADGAQAGKADGVKEGATAERARISAILASDEAKKRPVAAMSLAMETDMTTDKATALLAKLPEEAAAAPAAPAAPAPVSAFEQAMGTSENPNLGVGADVSAPVSRAEAAFLSAGYSPKTVN